MVQQLDSQLVIGLSAGFLYKDIIKVKDFKMAQIDVCDFT